MSCTTTFWPGGGREELGESESFVKFINLVDSVLGFLSVLVLEGRSTCAKLRQK